MCVEVRVLRAYIFAFQLLSSNFIPKAHMFGDNVSALKPGRLSQVSQEALISSFCSHRINYCQGQPRPPAPPSALGPRRLTVDKRVCSHSNSHANRYVCMPAFPMCTKGNRIYTNAVSFFVKQKTATAINLAFVLKYNTAAALEN